MITNNEMVKQKALLARDEIQKIYDNFQKETGHILELRESKIYQVGISLPIDTGVFIVNIGLAGK